MVWVRFTIWLTYSQFTVLFTKAGLISSLDPVNLLLAMAEIVILLYLLILPCEIIRRFFPFLLGQKRRA